MSGGRRRSQLTSIATKSLYITQHKGFVTQPGADRQICLAFSMYRLQEGHFQALSHLDGRIQKALSHRNEKATLSSATDRGRPGPPEAGRL